MIPSNTTRVAGALGPGSGDVGVRGGRGVGGLQGRLRLGRPPQARRRRQIHGAPTSPRRRLLSEQAHLVERLPFIRNFLRKVGVNFVRSQGHIYGSIISFAHLRFGENGIGVKHKSLPLMKQPWDNH